MSFYDELVRSTPLVCSNCFRKIREEIELNYAPVWTDFKRELEDRELEPNARHLEDEVPFLAYREIDADAAPDTLRVPIKRRTEHYDDSGGRRRVCVCGMDSPYTTERPIPKERAKDMLRRLIELVEVNAFIEIDEDTAWDAFRNLKEDPDAQFDDDEIFEQILKRSVTQHGLSSSARPRHAD